MQDSLLQLLLVLFSRGCATEDEKEAANVRFQNLSRVKMVSLQFRFTICIGKYFETESVVRPIAVTNCLRLLPRVGAGIYVNSTIYHGFSERESTKTPNALVELKSLPVGNCEPIRVLVRNDTQTLSRSLSFSSRHLALVIALIRLNASLLTPCRNFPIFLCFASARLTRVQCTDTPLRTRGRNGRWGSHSLPGPAIVVTFTANKETLVYDEYDVIAIKNPSALHQRMTFWQAKRSRAFGDLLVAPALSQAVKQTYPTWWEDFGLGSGPQAEWISAPLSVKPPYVPDRRPMSALFLIQPPYCAPPYVSRPRQTAGR